GENDMLGTLRVGPLDPPSTQRNEPLDLGFEAFATIHPQIDVRLVARIDVEVHPVLVVLA
ncbi:MAG: hypothetical protein QOF35_1380, partial [Actinomycetota bacterium]|nr:hypothetical protein [Actinomycetota bacterium]